MSNKTSTKPYKGARDFYPEDKRLQKWMFDKWRKVAEKYGYEEYDAPILEPTDLYLMKGSEEIVQEQTYTFTDRGDRSVTIRTEMTPTVSRMVAGKRQELAYPLRWYSIPNLWRYERMQRGRLREFWQLNVDIFGVDSIEADIEIIQVADDLLQAFKAKRSQYEIKVNSRVLVNTMLAQAGLDEEQSTAAVRLIDRIHKLSPEAFSEKLDEITGSADVSAGIVKILQAKTPSDLPSQLRELQCVLGLEQLLHESTQHGIRNISFDITIMRGFDYYTDIVFEVFDTDPENNRAMYGGGRYDGLVGQFGVEPVATVGFGMGDVTFMNFLESHGLLPDLRPPAEAAIVVREDTALEGAKQAASELREMGARVALDITSRKLDKQLKSAGKSGVRYIVFVGKEELAEGLYTIKDTKTNKEQKHSLQRIVSMLRDSRK